MPVEESTPLPLPADGAAGGVPGPAVSTWDFVRMLLLLAAVVAAIYVLFLVLRKVGGNRTEERGLIRVLDSKTLAPGRSLHLVQVAGQTYLVGASESSVSIVAPIPAKDSLDGDDLQGDPRLGAGRTFAGTVHELLRSRSPAGSAGVAAAAGTPAARPRRARPLAAGDGS